MSRPNQQPFEVALELTDRPMDLSSHSWHGLLARAWRSDLFQKIVQTYATQVVNIIVTLATTILVTRSLGPQGRGTYAVAITIGNLGVQLSHMGLHASNTYYVAKNRGLLSALLGNALFVSFGLSGALAVLAGVFFSLNPQMAPVHGLPLVFGLAWIPFGLALMLSENLLLGIHEVRAFNFLESLNRILGLALAGILVFVGMRQVGWFLGASFAALVLSFGTALWSVSRFVENWPVPNLRLLLSNFDVGFKAYVIVLLSFLVLRIDLLMVKYLLGAEQAGYYSVAASMADVCLLLPMAVSTILFPRLSGMIDLRERLVLTRKAALGIALALCPLLLVAGLLATPTVRLVFGAPFLPAASAFVWLVPGIFTLGIEIVFVQFLNSTGFPKSVIAVWVISTLSNVGSNLWAIPRFGILGASAVSSITYSLTCLLIILLASRTRAQVGAAV